MRRSAGLISISTSSGSGRTATVAAEVWMRPWASVAGTRWTRWTPLSNFSRPNTPSPVIEAMISLKPPASPSETLSRPLARERGQARLQGVELLAGERGHLRVAGTDHRLELGRLGAGAHQAV